MLKWFGDRVPPEYLGNLDGSVPPGNECCVDATDLEISRSKITTL